MDDVNIYCMQICCSSTFKHAFIFDLITTNAGLLHIKDQLVTQI